MPPPRGTPNPLEGPGDYDVTPTVHSDTYPEIDPAKTDLSGKAVLVTGGSRGIGRAIVLAYARAGASFIAAAARSGTSDLAADVEAAALSANRTPPKYLPITLDVSSIESVKAAAVALEKEFGRCDVIVNNAGVFGDFSLLGDYDPKTWSNVFDVNVRGPYLVTQTLLPLMIKTGDAYVVNISSVGAILTAPTVSAYQISKTALFRLSDFINKEYSEKGVISFAVHPGNCITDMAVAIGADQDPLYKEVFVDTPELCANTLVFLTSEKRAWVGGRYINVTWDMPQLAAKQQEIVNEDKLKLTLKY
ncbi:hypothetical protein V1506DRAFT_477467 [Lipomyces tetrasporus]